MRPASNPPDATIRTPPWPASSSALRTFHTSSGTTPVGRKRPISCHRERSTIVLLVSRRTPHSRGPSASATSRAVRTESFSKLTSTVTLSWSANRSANFRAASTVSPPYAAISPCGTVPMPLPPHHDACASVETPIAPAMCAAHPSPVWTCQWSKRAGKYRIGLPPAASTTSRTLRLISVRRASTPEVQRLEVGEQAVVAADRHDGLPRLDLVAVVERADLQPVPAVLPAAVREPPARAEPQDRERLVDPAEHGALALEHLHQHVRVVAVLLQHVAGEREVRVAVVAVAHLLHGQRERGRVEARAPQRAHGRPPRRPAAAGRARGPQEPSGQHARPEIPIAMTPSQIAVSESSSPDPPPPPVAPRRRLPRREHGLHRRRTGGGRPGLGGSSPAFSGGPVQGLTLPSAYAWRAVQTACPDSNGVPKEGEVGVAVRPIRPPLNTSPRNRPSAPADGGDRPPGRRRADRVDGHLRRELNAHAMVSASPARSARGS